MLLTLVLSRRTDTQVLPLGLTGFVLEYSVDWGSMTAVGVIMFVPTLPFVFVAQRFPGYFAHRCRPTGFRDLSVLADRQGRTK